MGIQDMKVVKKLEGAKLGLLEDKVAALSSSSSNAPHSKASCDMADQPSADITSSSIEPIAGSPLSSTTHSPGPNPTHIPAGTVEPFQHAKDSPSAQALGIRSPQDGTFAADWGAGQGQDRGSGGTAMTADKVVCGSGIYDPAPPDKYGKKGATRPFPGGTGHFW